MSGGSTGIANVFFSAPSAAEAAFSGVGRGFQGFCFQRMSCRFTFVLGILFSILQKISGKLVWDIFRIVNLSEDY